MEDDTDPTIPRKQVKEPKRKKLRIRIVYI